MGVRRIIHTLLLGLVLGVAFSFGFTPERSDNDVWWHLKTGQFIVENGYRLPVVDPLNHMVEKAGIAWHNHEWAAQILYWWTYLAGEQSGVGGLRALLLGKALILGFTYLALALFAARMAGATLPGILAALLAAEVGRRTFYARPPVFTYPMLVGLYALLHAVRVERLGKRWLAAVLPFFCLWANVHGGWAAGLVMLGCFGVGACVESLQRHYRATPLIALPRAFLRDVLPWAGAGLLAVVGTLGNPGMHHLYGIFGRVMKDQQLVGAIGELAPPDVRFTGFFLFSILLFVVLGLAVRRPFPHAAEYLLLPFFLWQALHHVRHLTLWGLLMAPTLAWLLGEALRQLPKGVAGLARAALVGIALLASAYWVAWRSEGGTYLQRNAELARGTAFYREAYPAESADFLRDASLVGLRGELYNLDYYAGFLIWRLSPQPYRVFSDPRFDIFGGDIMRLANGLLEAPDGWDATLRQHDVNIALLPLGKILTQAMIRDADWELLFWELRARPTRDGDLALDPLDGWAVLARRSAHTPATLAAARALAARRLAELGMPPTYTQPEGLALPR